MLNDMTGGRLEEAKAYADKIEDKSLQECLDQLQKVDDNLGYDTFIVTDFAPLSFEFIRRNKDRKIVGGGGIIFHGRHDGFGSGQAPTFSVSVTPSKGWQIHT